MTTGDYRGKGYSTKLSKIGEPKRAGNWSYSSIHAQGLQQKTYRVYNIDGKLIVGEHTPLDHIFPAPVVMLAMNDPYFSIYSQSGYKTVGGKKYEACRTLVKCDEPRRDYFLNYFSFYYTKKIYTDLDFNYNFPEY